MWLIIALIGYVTLAVVSILDKFILSKEKVSPLRFVFYSCVFVLPVLIFAPWVASPMNLSGWLATFLSGIGFALGLWTMYLGIEKSEISHIEPLIGGATPPFVLFFSYFFLRECVSGRAMMAIFLLVIGSLLISAEYTKKGKEWHGAMLWGLASAIFFAISHVASKYLYDQIGFVSGFIWGKGFIGICGLLLLLYPPFYKQIFRAPWWKKNKIQPNKKSDLFIVGIDKILGVIAVILIQYAIALGSVTIVNALAGAQYAVLLILILVLSKFWPRVFREEYTKMEIAQEVAAIIIIGAGLVLLM